MPRTLRWAAVCIPMLAAAGCQSGPPVDVSEVLNHGMCKKLRRGLSRIEFSQLAQIRGITLLKDTSSSGSSSSASSPSSTAASAAPTPNPPAVLFAVSNGSQPSAGYGFELRGAHADGKDVVLEYTWLQPAPGTIVAQVVTSPCSVVEISNLENAQAVTALLDGVELGRISLTSSTRQ